MKFIFLPVIYRYLIEAGRRVQKRHAQRGLGMDFRPLDTVAFAEAVTSQLK